MFREIAPLVCNEPDAVTDFVVGWILGMPLPESVRETAALYFAARIEADRAERKSRQASIAAIQAQQEFEAAFKALRPLPGVGDLMLFLEFGYGVNLGPDGVVEYRRLTVPVPKGG